MSSPDSIERLQATLRRRETPETVAELVRGVFPAVDRARILPSLARVIGGSGTRWFGWSSMATTFREPVGAEWQVNRARELVALFLGGHLPESDDPDAVGDIVREFDRLIGKSPGRSRFEDDRPNRTARREMGLTLSRRRYSRLFRPLAKLRPRVDYHAS